jgi:hypothetical protein
MNKLFILKSGIIFDFIQRVESCLNNTAFVRAQGNPEPPRHLSKDQSNKRSQSDSDCTQLCIATHNYSSSQCAINNVITDVL